jgi:hypothetical protein
MLDTRQPMAAAASAAERVLSSNSSTVKSGPSAAWTRSAFLDVAGFT